MIVLNILGAILLLVGVLVTFEARRLVKKYFNYGAENVATLGMKILGFTVAVIGGLIMILCN